MLKIVINHWRVSAFFVAFYVSLMAFFPGPAGSATGPMIVYPPDRALLTGDGSLDLLGFLPGGSAGSVTIAGKSGSRSQPVGAGAFTVKVKLDPGENSLVLQDRKVTVFLAEGAPVTIPPGYSPPDTHAIENGCEECHSFSGTEAKLLEKPPALCARCHDDVLKPKSGKVFAVPHPPAQEGDCFACHPFHQLAIKRLPAAAKRELCFGCHDPFPEEEDGKKLVLHKPVETGECASCHKVHGSDTKKLLPAQGKALCVKCHPDPSRAPDGAEWPATHPALDEGCPSCHLPHVAPAAGLLKKPQASLCADCHDAFVPPAADKGGSIHLPVAQGACARCHAPHGSATRKLLLASPTRELCLTCHANTMLAADGTPWAVPHPALDDGCPTCHRPHVADAPRLLTKPEQLLCLDCHEDKNIDKAGQKWSSTHAPVVAGLCASCHGLHGAPEKALLKKSPFEICRTCHTEVHERHQQIEIDPITKLPASEKATLPAGFPFRKKDGMLSCIGCHLPHGSDTPQLWSSDEATFCYQCHTAF